MSCETQDEIDYFWEKISAGGQEQQGGWLKDKFGLSRQIPVGLEGASFLCQRLWTARVATAVKSKFRSAIGFAADRPFGLTFQAINDRPDILLA